ncbi:MAG: phosphatidylglycerophosphatase A family protein [Brevinematia bacterium]
MKRILDFIIRFFATGIFVGHLPFFRGTFGTLIGVLIFVLLSGYNIIFYTVLVLLLILSFPITNYAERNIFKEKDSSYIVIDEIVGYLISVVGFKFTWDANGIFILVMTFLIFRIFDIFKPYPIVHIESIQGGVGIVLDDVFSGIMTNLIVRLMLAFQVTNIFIPNGV